MRVTSIVGRGGGSVGARAVAGGGGGGGGGGSVGGGGGAAAPGTFLSWKRRGGAVVSAPADLPTLRLGC